MQVARDIVAQCHSDIWLVMGRFTVVAFGGIVWGLVAAHITYLWLKVSTYNPCIMRAY